MIRDREISSEKDYDAALTRVTELMDALSSPEGQIDDASDPNRVELEALTNLIELYEDQHHPIDHSNSVLPRNLFDRFQSKALKRGRGSRNPTASKKQPTKSA